MMGTAAAVALFVRRPVPGRVKTRLAAGIGDEAACRLYRAMVADCLAQIRESGLPLWLFHDNGDPDDLPAEWLAAAAVVRRQVEGDLGGRMAAAFMAGFAAGIGRVVLIGSDLPGIDVPALTAAVAELAAADAVFAPTVDGGYGLVGLRREGFHPELFDRIPWSSARVMAVTTERCRQAGIQFRLLPTLLDIDTVADLDKYAASPAPHAHASNATVLAILSGSRRRG